VNLLAVVGFGGLIGFGVWLAVRAVAQPVVPLADAVSTVRSYRPAAQEAPISRTAQLAPLAVRLLVALGQDPARRRSDLRVAERSVEQHAFVRVGVALAGVVAPIMMLTALAAAGVHLPVLAGIGFVAVGAALGIVHPEAHLREIASQRRRDGRRALAAYIDLVRVLIAGGSDPRAALVDAAQLGHGWLFAELRGALVAAVANRLSMWSALEDLGRDLELAELTELAATVQLVGTEGTDPVGALTAKAAALRAFELATTRAEMASASEEMTVPAVLIGFCFAAFIVYPALSTLLSGP
jgi:Flp pilus assembly protein TadB